MKWPFFFFILFISSICFIGFSSPWNGIISLSKHNHSMGFRYPSGCFQSESNAEFVSDCILRINFSEFILVSAIWCDSMKPIVWAMCNKQTSNDNKVCLYDCDIVVFDRLNTHLVGFESQNMLQRNETKWMGDKKKTHWKKMTFTKKEQKNLHFISAVVMVFRPGA